MNYSAKAGSRAIQPGSRGLPAIHLAVFLFGFSGLFGKFLDCHPALIVLGRTSFACLALLPFLLSSGLPPFKGTARELGVYAAQGILLAVHWCTFFYSIQLSSVAVGLLTFSTFPLFVTLLEPLFFPDKLTREDLFTAISVFLGLILVIPSFDLSRSPAQGAVWGTLSGLTFALLAIINRKNVLHSHPLSVAFHQNLFAALALIPAILFIAPPMPTSREWFLLACLGIVCTAAAHTLFIHALITIKATTAGIITALEPVYGIILALLFLQEIPGLKTLAGGTIILAASIRASRMHTKKQSTASI